MKAFVLHEPSELAEAAHIARRYAGQAAFLAGGTDLVVQMNRRKRTPAHVIDLSRLSGMSEICRHGGVYSIGALATHKTIERHPAVRTEVAMLAEAASLVGGHQIRNIATIGGNVMNASPAADTMVPLLALDAELHFVGAERPHRLLLRDYLSERGKPGPQDDAVLTRIAFPDPGEFTTTAFLKAGRRAAMEISMVSVASMLALDPRGRISSAAIALGSVGATALRCPESEAMLAGSDPSPELFRDVANVAVKECKPISDPRASAAYRSILVVGLVERALMRCLQAGAAGKSDSWH